MFKRVVCIVCAGIFFFGTVGLSNGQQKDKDAMAQVTVQKVEVGNKICPVLGGKIDEKTKATYEYQGKIYNFCCAMCIDEFKRDPEKYIKKVEDELKGASEAKSK